jgi:hypothetical protein
LKADQPLVHVLLELRSHQVEEVVADRDHVALLEHGELHAAAVHEGAVGAPQIRKLVALRPLAQFGVIKRHEQVVQHDVVVARATDSDARPGSLKDVADEPAEDATHLDRLRSRWSPCFRRSTFLQPLGRSRSLCRPPLGPTYGVSRQFPGLGDAVAGRGHQLEHRTVLGAPQPHDDALVNRNAVDAPAVDEGAPFTLIEQHPDTLLADEYSVA